MKIRSRKSTSKQKLPSFKWSLFALAVLLTIFGVVMVYNSSIVQAYRDFHDKYYFLKRQVFWAGLGFALMIFLSFVDYRVLKKFAFPILIFSALLLVMVFLPGIGSKVKGAHRWLSIGENVIQPAEFAKLAIIFYLSSFFSGKEGKVDFLRFVVIVGIFAALLMLEPDLGTTIVLVMVTFILYFIAGGSFVNVLMLVPIGIIGTIGLIFLAPYRLKRLETFLSTIIDPARATDPLGASYHIRQVLIGLGSGGFWGVGLGRSRQKYEYLPEATTDSIFAVIGEELGFIGATVLIAVLMFLVYQGFSIAKNAPDRFGKLLGFGLTSFIAVQALINLAAMVALVPLTGIPLPFISYGGSSLLSVLAAVGILLNISRHRSG